MEGRAQAIYPDLGWGRVDLTWTRVALAGGTTEFTSGVTLSRFHLAAACRTWCSKLPSSPLSHVVAAPLPPSVSGGGGASASLCPQAAIGGAAASLVAPLLKYTIVSTGLVVGVKLDECSSSGTLPWPYSH
jgi:hypothetical protein